ncbi:cytochrome P450 [Agrocybe pediades]|nr:cytochrome P450 [Agrocybe pediades]
MLGFVSLLLDAQYIKNSVTLNSMGAYLVPASVPQLLFSVFVLFVAYGLLKLFQLIASEITSPIRDLPGPPSKSFLFGNINEMKAEDAVLEKYVAKYGDTIKYQDMLGVTRLCTVDLKAINHVLMHSNDYQKPEPAIYHVKRIIGQGVLLVEGDVHKQQRKILNPAFGTPQIRQLTEIFVDKAIELRDVWNSEIQKQNKSSGEGIVDAMSWLSRMTLDVIGRAGFDYDFQALSSEHSKNELNRAFETLYNATMSFDVIPAIRSLVPPLRFLPAPGDSRLKQAKDTVFRIGGALLERSKKNAFAYGKSNTDRDILSLLTRANMDPDVPTNQRMSDEDVLSRSCSTALCTMQQLAYWAYGVLEIPTFLFAGHETTSTGTTWALYELSQHKDIQSKLREELLSVPTDNPSMDELNELHYLDNVVRESLRLHPPIPGTLRVAMKDDYLPLSKPFKDRNGVLRHEIRIVKGQTFTIPIRAINRAESTWGKDAIEFNPDRWDNLPETVSAIPGVWGHLMSFLGGPRSCIGYRFSLIEMKALLFTLIRAFEIDLAVPPDEIKGTMGLIRRPIVTSDLANPNQLPIIIRPVVQS